MKYSKFTIPLILTLFFISCNNDHNKNSSRVEYFQYQGYSDTIVSLLYGQVFEQTNRKDKKMIPIPNVHVTVIEDTVNSITDSSGNFLIPLYGGTFTLKITKDGYQPLIMSNYFSHSDRVSNTKIILVKGAKKNEFRIPDKIIN